jgi:WD40 repeat protein
MARYRILCVLSLICCVLAACAGNPAPPPTLPPVPSSTLVPSSTPSPRPTLTPTTTSTPTATPLPTATFTSTPVLPAFASTPALDSAQALNPANLDRLFELARWGSGQVEDLAWTPDNRWLVVRTSTSSYLFDSISMTQQHYFNGNIVYSGIGELFASFTPDNRIHVWRASDWVEQYSFDGTRPQFSSDGTLLAALVTDGIRLGKAVDGVQVSLLSHAGADRLHFSSDSSLLATISRDAIHIWKTGDGSEVFKVEPGRVLRTSFSNDGSLFFIQSRSPQGQVSLGVWQVKDWRKVGSIQTSGTYVLQPDSRQLFVFSNYPVPGQVLIYNLPDGKLVSQFRTDGSIYRLAVSPDSKIVAISIPDPITGRVVLYDSTGKLVKKLYCEHSCDAATPVFSPDSKQIIIIGHMPIIGLDVGVSLIYDTATARLVRMLRSPRSVKSEISELAISPDGTQIATYTDGQEHGLRVWASSDGKLVSALDWGDRTLFLGNLSPDGRLVAAYSDMPVVKLLKLKDGSLVRQFDNSSQPLFSNSSLLLVGEQSGSRFAGLRLRSASSGDSLLLFSAETTLPFVFSPTDELAATARDAAVRLIQLPAGKMIGSFAATGRPNVLLDKLAFSPDGTYLCAGDRDGGVWLWRLADRKQVFNAAGNHNPVVGLAFSPDGKLVVAGGSDGSVIVRNVEDGQAVLTLSLLNILKTTLGEDIGFDALGGLSYSPDGRLLVVSGTLNPLQSFPNRVRVSLLLQASDGKLLRILPGGGGQVLFTPDGKELLASGDGAIHVWGIFP